jgi:inorganic pyrophosphatase/exopolyphosphatase
LHITLVDHNSLSSNFSAFATCVVEIVDHHEDLKADFPNLQRKQIEVVPISSCAHVFKMVGSATTLVAEQFLNSVIGLEKVKEDTALRKLLLGNLIECFPYVHRYHIIGYCWP